MALRDIKNIVKNRFMRFDLSFDKLMLVELPVHLSSLLDYH